MFEIFNIPELCLSGSMEITPEGLDGILGALAEQLGSLGTRQEIVVVGGSALVALGLVRRIPGGAFR
jgi:hypothetical protein